MTLFDTKANKVVDFANAAKADRLIDKMHPDKRAIVEDFVEEFLVSIAPAEALRDYHLKLAPIELVFARTRTLAKSAIAALDSWSGAAGNVVAVLAETGAWLLGDNPAEDLERLQKFTAAFVKFYGSGGLPPALKAEELRKQVAAHHKATAEQPVMPAGQTLSALNAGQRDLSAACNLAFETFHDFLDGYFGKRGDDAFAAKSSYGYDRRAGRYQVSKPGKTEGGGTGSGDGSGAGTGAGESAAAAKKEAAKK